MCALFLDSTTLLLKYFGVWPKFNQTIATVLSPGSEVLDPNLFPSNAAQNSATSKPESWRVDHEEIACFDCEPRPTSG